MRPPIPAVSKKPIVLGIVTGLLLAAFHRELGALFIIALGAAIGYVVYLRDAARLQRDEFLNHIGALIDRVSSLESADNRADAETSAAPAMESSSERVVAGSRPSAPPQVIVERPVRAPGADVEPARVVADEPATSAPPAIPAYFKSTPRPSPVNANPSPAGRSLVEHAVSAARDWLLGGNTVARVGLLVLFVGVAFLLRYVAERTEVPIEMRLAGVALGAFALLVLGWRLRITRPGYAVTLQGGAIGILYLTVFAALRLYDVVPPAVSFAMLTVLAGFSAVLAIAQNARPLAVLGATGGFLAPILVSTGEGRIEILLSFYLLLNVGVLAIAWFRSWRELNWIAFAFTFGVFGVWAIQRHTAQHYFVAQLFLAAFWVLFLAVSLLYALRQPQATRGAFDTTLMFALPLVAFGIQSRLIGIVPSRYSPLPASVQSAPFDSASASIVLAFAAVIAASVYLFSSALLMRRRDPALRLLVEAHFGVGVAFLTLAVPLAASAQWTAAAWTLEGLAVLWIGMRQQRLLPAVAGLVLHIAGAFALARALDVGSIDALPRFSGLTLNLVVFVITAFASSLLLARMATPTAAERFGTLVANAPVAMRLVGWAWAVLLIWQPLAFPWYVVGWCVLSLGLIVADRRTGHAALSPEWVAGAVVVIVAWGATELRDGGAAGLDVTTLLRLAVTVTAITVALISLAGSAFQRTAAASLLTFGVLVWLLAVLAQTFDRIADPFAAAQIALIIVAVTAAALIGLARIARWDWPLKLSWAYFIAHAVLAGAVVIEALDNAHMPSRHYGWVVWPLAWLAFYAQLKWDERAPLRVPDSVRPALHVIGAWLATAMIAAEAALRIDTIAGDGWFHAAWGVVMAIALWLIVQHATRWPMRAAPRAYASIAAPGLAIVLVAWVAWVSVHTAGDPTPIPYLPVLNPLDVATLLALAAFARWHVEEQREQVHAAARFALGAAAFIALNAAALRAVHFLTGAPWRFDALAESFLVQAVLSLLWTITAMALMVFAHRKALRGWWLIGAALLSLVVLKLFVVDLDGQGTIERIVSFVGVGGLILVIGYLAPVPPSSVRPARSLA
ncbi:MAG TPA: DUF2339 domain-containing protein [Casimicrobiaceae bacterium]|nr:DUF2339 domain-containing protein [Casimicrobiaceae bacterium]